MPSREPTGFSAAHSTTAPTRSSGHSASSRSAKESRPSAAVPARHSTKPSAKLRAALPLPSRANTDSSRGASPQPNSPSTAFASAAKPDADDAKPAAVGTVLRAFSSKTKSGPGRNKSKNALARRANELSADSCFPLSQIWSVAPAPRANSTCEPSGPSEIDRLPVTGRFSASSRLPQYFTSAMFAGA